MDIHTYLVTCDDTSTSELLKSVDFFALQHDSDLWDSEVLSYAGFLENLVFQIARKPKCLTRHVQRVYYCFHSNLSEQLFAGIVDLLIVLNKKGLAVSLRLIMGAKSRLDSDQVEKLLHYLDDNDANLLAGNRYSIFSKGLLGNRYNEMIRYVELDVSEPEYDPLAMARDYIEYSQLDEAQAVLEKAVLDYPYRLDFQQELVEFYQSTRDSDGFYSLFSKLIQSGVAMCDEWDKLNNYFKGQNNNG
jgi:hypothetical protein